MGSILLVEPEQTIADQWASELEAAGHSVIVVSSLREALVQVGSGGIDVVTIDAHGDAHGSLQGVVDLARNIEALPDAPPIILASGLPRAPEISARIGAAHFLPTPCDPAELVGVVNRVLGHVRPVLVVEDEPTGPRYPTTPRN